MGREGERKEGERWIAIPKYSWIREISSGVPEHSRVTTVKTHLWQNSKELEMNGLKFSSQK